MSDFVCHAIGRQFLANVGSQLGLEECHEKIGTPGFDVFVIVSESGK